MSGLGDVEPPMDLLGAIVDRHVELDAPKVRRLYPLFSSAECICPHCGGDTEVRLVERTVETEPDVVVQVEPGTLTCRSCGAVTEVQA